MTYVDGFLTPVPADGQEAYLAFTRRAWAMFRDLGATGTMECWEDDVPDGQQTDFRRAVQAAPGEKVVFSWILWPDRPTRDAAMAKMSDATVIAGLGGMPFDGRRMIFGGFTPIMTSEDAT
ncbi:DUF1428 domain-containing protein [Acidimangrovimonas sediminis]|uniref:DUF1428 domain-containing protein n=1 Tax=Acidimangrovimonas sediminis TaxID=2056283 RepID=UPI000C80BF20|nr:DUF1428 domain-containing protein [Acidimangrovimonas sediminis]